MNNVHALSRPGFRVGGPILDTLMNLLSGLGTAKDKSTQTQFVMNVIDRGQLLSAYRGDWIARKIIDIPAQDSTREWREWQAEKTDITKIEEAERVLRVQLRVRQAMQRSRLFGGAALIMGVNQGSPDQELRVDRVKQGQLQYLHVVNRDEITPDQLNYDVTSEFYGEPTSYRVNSSTTGVVAVHPSRVIRFIGNEIPDVQLATDGWGDSVLQTIYDAVIQAGQTAANVASLVNEAKIDVVKIPGMMEKVGTAEYRSKLLERFTLANSMKSLTNTLMLDAEEEWDRITAQFAGLPDIIKMYLLMASGAADIPATRLLGQSASGFNATGEADTRNYYDRLSSDQKNDLGPSLDRLDEVMIRSTFGSKPEEITYDWRSLWQLSDTESAEIAAKKAQVFTADVTANLIPPEVLREGRENQLIEDGVYPGLELAIEQYGEQNLDEYNQAVVAQMGARAALQAPENPDDPASTARAKSKATQLEFKRRKALPPPRPPAARSQDVRDETKPRSLYVRRDVLNGEEILAHFEEQGVDVSGVDPQDLHVTVLYSRQPVDWIKMGESNSWYAPGQDDGEDAPEGTDMCVRAGGPRVMEEFGTPPDTLVMCFASSQLCWRHEDMIQRGASADYPDYTPHLSVAPWDGDADPRTIEPYQGEIYLGPEVFEPVKSGGAEGEAYDYDPSEPRARAGTSAGGQWTREGAAAARQARIDRVEAQRRARAEGDVGARLKRTREAAVARSKRIAAAAAHKTIQFLRDEENRAEGLGMLASSLTGHVTGADVAARELIHSVVTSFAAQMESHAAAARGAVRAALKEAIKLRRGLTGDAGEEQEGGGDDVLEVLLALLSALDDSEEPVKDWRYDVKKTRSGKSARGRGASRTRPGAKRARDYSPDQPRAPAGSGRGGQFTTIVGGEFSDHARAAGLNVKLFKSKRLGSGRAFEVDLTTRQQSGLLKPMSVEVAQQFRVGSKWRKNPDQAGDYAAGVGLMLAKQFPGLARFAEQFWYDAAAGMTPREYAYAKSYFATRDGAFAEGYRAAFSPNGKAFGLSKARAEEVFGRSVGQLRTGVGSAISGSSSGGSSSSGVFARMGRKLSSLIGAS
jgi:phage-related protein (TIGR01555 family)